MKQRKRWLFLAIAPALLLLAGLTSPAHAADYSGDCAGVPASVTGNVDITDSTCTISHPVSATGYIHISASGAVSTSSLTTTWGDVSVVTTSGGITTGTISSGWNVTLTAVGNVVPSAITSSGGSISLTSSNGQVQASTATAMYSLYINAKEDITTQALQATNGELLLTSTEGLIDTGNLTAKYTIALDADSTVDAQLLTTSDGAVTVTSNTGDITVDDIDSKYDANISTDSGTITTQEITSSLGNVVIDASGEINTKELTSGTSRYVKVVNEEGNITTEKLTAGGSVRVKTENGDIDIAEIRSNRDDTGGAVALLGSNNVKVGNIDGHGTAKSGVVEIRSNMSGANALFTIGGTGQTNGVNGTINITSANGGGTDPYNISSGVYIVIGTTASTGGITVTNPTDIQVNATASRSGFIMFDAREGTLTLPSGTLQSDGTSTAGAGSINLMAKEVHFESGATVSASQNLSASPTVHGVFFAAETVSFSGAGGLTVHADGKGVGEYYAASVVFVPKDAFNVVSSTETSDSVNSIFWYTAYNYDNINNPVNITGAGSAPFTATADGDFARVSFQAFPTTFSGGDVTVHSRGATPVCQ